MPKPSKHDSIQSQNDYVHLLKIIKSQIQSARIKASKSVNRELILLYWDIGKGIVEKQKKLGWGKSVVEQLSKDIQKEFSGINGYSPDNLWRMRQMYEEYSKPAILEQAVPEIDTRETLKIIQQLISKIPWGHNILIMKKVKNIKERLYYIAASGENGWSRDVLLNQIKADAYSRQKLSDKQHNFGTVLPEHLAEQADEALKDSYMLDFLGIGGPVKEREMENRMIEKIRDVIIEFGYGFAFIGNQYRVQTETGEYFIDLLFYHRMLKSLIAIELKTGKFKPEYAGKMNFYLNLLDDYVREDDENPSIGIILCADRDRLEVEYSLRNLNKPIGVAEYLLTRELPAELEGKLPAPDELGKHILKELKK